jgi:hypothetical protein
MIPHFVKVNEVLKKHSSQIAKLEESKIAGNLEERVAEIEGN